MFFRIEFIGKRIGSTINRASERGPGDWLPLWNSGPDRFLCFYGGESESSLGLKKCLQSFLETIPQAQVGHWKKKKRPYFRYTRCLIGILIMVYCLNPHISRQCKFLYTLNNQLFLHCSSRVPTFAYRDRVPPPRPMPAVPRSKSPTRSAKSSTTCTNVRGCLKESGAFVNEFFVC